MTEIREYKSSPPEWIKLQQVADETEPFYPLHESGRCLTMDEQEQLMGQDPEDAFDDR